MDKQKGLQAIDAAIRALTGLEQAMKRNDECGASIELQTLWLDLGNLRAIVEKAEEN